MQPGDNDASVTGFAVMVLKSAELGELPFSDMAYKGATAFFDSVTDPVYYDVGYMIGRKSRCRHKSMVGVASMYRLFVQKDRKSPKVSGGVRILTENLPAWRKGDIDFYYWYYGTQVMHHVGGAAWREWNHSVRDVLVDSQETSGHQAGSWEPQGQHDVTGGRLYTTALVTCTLEVYYRHVPIFRQIEL